ncbi:hypothetical protein MML48_2g00009098 [Holotrichia oblita]|uniref:Uncharacterized protein n=2 Tax=Holotrichia oblita TaxID=644536 RepID=A0ACB9TLI1_HOLOL|nr:hypothetical protein MML48_2g00010697 [Holotrichia oblita]KAI4467612.1 hypothetical protein MML48_2g00009098 [Holotrichia oblita]
MANNNQQNFYSNPAFCQQSEYYHPNQQQQKCRSPPRPTTINVRHPPVGAQTRVRIRDGRENGNNCYEEQEFYEEMIVDDAGLIKEKKVVIVSSPQESNYPINHRYEYIDDNIDKKVSKYEQIQHPNDKSRSEYIPLKRQESTKGSRYAAIPSTNENDSTNNNSGKYALVPVEDLANHHYTVISEDDIKAADRYEYIEAPSQEKPPPYNELADKRRPIAHQNMEVRKMVSPRKGNPIATQKLHELLSTPRKTPPIHNPPTSQRILSPQSPRKNISPQHQREIFITPNNIAPKIVRSTSRAQQKLNYAIGTRQSLQHQDNNKRHTAIVTPICSSPVQSVYSETTFSQKTESWMNLSVIKPPVQATLAIAAVMMLLCGGVSFGLCLYMISLMGRLYYLDFGTIAGFTCLILGLMGFRTRNCYWLPNRNYISGKIIIECNLFKKIRRLNSKYKN